MPSEKRKAYLKLYREKNREKLRAKRLKYIEKHPAYDKEYRKKNADKIRNYQREYCRTPKKKEKLAIYRNRVEVKERRRILYNENRAEMNRKHRIYYEKNREREIKRLLKYLKTPKGKLKWKISNQRRRATKAKMIHSFSKKEWDNKLQQTKGICPMCKKNVGIDKLQLDHILPLSKALVGTIYTIKDIQPLCGHCNSSKGIRIINAIDDLNKENVS